MKTKQSTNGLLYFREHLSCEKIYDRDEELKKEFKKRQLKLFADG